MAEESTTTETTTTSTDGAPYTLKEYLLYKLDRTLAIAGLIFIGIWALSKNTPEAMQIPIAVVGILGGYVGGRTGK